MASQKVRDGAGRCLAEYKCCKCGTTWQEWVEDPRPDSEYVPRVRGTCLGCAAQTAAPAFKQWIDRQRGGGR